MRQSWEKHFKTVMEKEMMHDQIMEDYVMKKRMKRKIRNDFEDLNPILDEGEEIVELLDTGGKTKAGLKKIVLAII